MKILPKSIHLLVAVGLLTQCSPLAVRNLSKSQRGSLGLVNLPAGSMEKDAFQHPQSITLESAQTIGFFSGFTLGIVGGAIAAATVNAKQNSFEEKNKAEFAKIEAGTPKDLGAVLSSELKSRLMSDPFFGTRLSDKADGAKLTVTVHGVTLLKVAKDRGYSPAISVSATLTDSAGTKLLLRAVAADGYGFNKKASVTDAIAPLSTYANDPGLLRSHYLKVSAVAVNYLATELGKAANQ